MASSYRGDPYWTKARWSGTDAKGLPYRKGEPIFYYPKTRTVYAGVNAETASRQFEAEVADEDTYNAGYGSPYYGQ